MEKPAETDYPIHDLLRRRWSPRAFAERPVPPETLRGVLEAARWAPSSGNEQPWRYIVTARGEEGFDRLAETLTGNNRLWAPNAPVLMLSVAKTAYDRNGKPNRHAWHDVGAASAALTVEATARGLVAHQMGGFEPDAARAAFDIPEGFEPVAAIALGYPGDPDALPEPLAERERAPRRRIPVAAFAFGPRWGEPAPAVMEEDEAPQPVAA